MIAVEGWEGSRSMRLCWSAPEGGAREWVWVSRAVTRSHLGE